MNAKRTADKSRFIMPRWASLAMSAIIVWSILVAGSGGAHVAASGSGSSSGSSSGSVVAAPDATCPSGQCFTDVPPTNPFYTSTNNLFLDNIIGGYTCGGTGEPCDPQNRPYYRPANNVTRSQMSKFVDNGRKNISDAIGHSLFISTTAGIAVDARTSSGGEVVYAECLQSGNDCFAVDGSAPAGDYAGVFNGGRGVFAASTDNGYSGIHGTATGTTAGSYGGDFSSDNWNALRVEAPPAPNGRAQAFVSGTSGTLNALDVDPGAAYINGNLTVTGSKSGYVVDAMQNADTVPLEPGDVVVIVGQSAPVLGQIPVVTVKKATSAYDTGVVGVVDSALYVPDAATKATYEAQQKAVQQAETRRNQEMQAATAEGRKPDAAKMQMPDASITDAQGIPHATDAASIPVGGYANVVTLGSYKAVKVDASFGPVHAGDLLVASPHAGYAMKATDRTLTSGATVGKALGNLETGTGQMSVMVTLK